MRQSLFTTMVGVLAIAGAAHGAVPATTSPAPAVSVNQPQTEAERKAFAPGDKSPAAVVNAFDQMAFFDHHPVEAMKRYLSDDFIERSPDFARTGYANDKDAMIAFFTTRGWDPNSPMKDTIYQVIADSDRAVVFHKVTKGPTDRGIAFVDIFRVQDGLIVEHWAVSQPVPANTTARHSMF